MSDVLVPNNKGNYSFIRGIAPYSAGVVAADGHEIVHARFVQPISLTAGFSALREHVAAAGRPIQAVCGIELRSPRPFTFDGFAEFNAGYVERLREFGIIEDGVNPVARTNIAPAIAAPPEPSMYGFSYTAPAPGSGRTFVVAGAGELPEGSLDSDDVVRRGETSSDAIREKAAFVIGLMSQRLAALGATWDQATTINAYTVHSICDFLAEEIIRPMSGSAVHGLTWHYSRPPILSIEYEMDVRGTDRDVVLGRH
jgi:hypothetical protein